MYLKNDKYNEDLKNAFKGIVNSKELFNKKILITGATGLIGSFLVDLLLYLNKHAKAEIDIYALARSEDRLRTRFASSIMEKELNLVIQDVVQPLRLVEKMDYVIHAAGDGYPLAFREHPVETMTPAMFGTYELLEYARRSYGTRVLYISSGEIYGKRIGQNRAFSEEEVGEINSMDVRSCYPMAKRCAETLCASYYAQYNVEALVARLSHTYGSCTSLNDNRATVQFLMKAVAGEDIVLHSEGNQMRSYTYIADCAAGILSVLINGEMGEAYNIANPDSRVTIAQFAEVLAKVAGTKCVKVLPNESAKKELTPIEYAVLDSSKLEKLGWKGQYDIQKGIKNMYSVGKAVWDKGN